MMSIDAPPTPTRTPYPVATMRRALEHHEAGWKPTMIRRLLRDEGLGEPSLNTINQWINPAYAERMRVWARARSDRYVAESTEFRMQGRSEAYRQAFMRRLRDEGVSYNGIAGVCRVVFGVTLVGDQVRWMLNETAT